MGDFVLGLAKSVVEGAVAKAQSAIEEEKKLQKSVQSDLVFITGEFQMMQSFLNATNEEHVSNNVVRTWVRQVRDLAYDVEDCIEFVVYLDNKPSWWFRMLPSCMAPALPLDEAIDEIKQLKARVQDVSRRNARYNLITDSGSKPVAVGQQQPMATAGTAAFDIVQEARDTARKHHGLVDLTELIANKDDPGLQVISLWGTDGDLGTASIIKKAYDDQHVREAFGCRSWAKVTRSAKLTRPFNPHEFLRSLVTQFSASSGQEQGATAGVDALTRMEAAAHDELVKDFMKKVEENRYLVVLEDVSTVVEWETIRMYLPDKKNGSRIVVSTQQLEITSLCTPQPCGLSELMQSSADHSVCVFYQGRPDGGTTTKETIDQVKASDDFERLMWRRARKNVTFEKMKLALDWKKDRAHVVGREKELSSLEFLLARVFFDNRVDRVTNVISVWGIAGVGKSTLVKDVYYTAVREPRFARCGWVDVSHSQPFDLREFSRSLLSDIFPEYLEAKKNGRFGVLVSDHLFPESPETLVKQREGSLGAAMLGFKDPIEECCKLLHEEPCLVVIDGLRSTEEWDLIKAALVTGAAGMGTCIIVIATEESVATHCSVQSKNVYNVKGLDAATALDLFKKEVFRKTETSDLDPNDEKIKLAELTVKKCGGLPKVISAISHFLATRRNMIWDWRSLNDDFMHELEISPEFDSLQGLFAWMHSYFRTCPDSLKPCIFYMSIFPGDHSIRRRRLLRRWMAEGYSRDTDSNTAEENGEMLFRKLVDLSIIQQPAQTVARTGMRMVVCQVNGFFGEYILSRSMEENLVFALEGRCSLNTQRTGRHLTIGSSWNRDWNVFEGIDFSRLRSLTVFGEWSRFFISDKMRLLRVLDLEGLSDKSCVTDDDLEHMVKRLSRLKFLSLRGCTTIHHLPDSLGGLKQLQTLDVRKTCIVTLPKTITKLQKLQYLRAGKSIVPSGDDAGTVTSLSAAENQLSTPTRSRLHPLASWLSEFCRPPLAGADHADGVEVPRGIGKLTALHTMGVVNVNVAEGEAILKELKNLTQLHKLGVSGVNRRNSQALCSAISGHGYLESLSVRLEKDNSEGCLDGISRPPETLQSLKLYGNVDKLPVWIKQLRKLRKLNLEITTLRQEDMYVLGVLPLRILRLFVKPIQDSRLHFCPEPEKGPFIFNMVKVLEIACNSRLNVLFAEGAMRNVEQLKVLCYSGSSWRFSGLEHLGLKQVLLKGSYDDALKEDLERQLAKHPKDIKPVLKLEELRSS